MSKSKTFWEKQVDRAVRSSLSGSYRSPSEPQSKVTSKVPKIWAVDFDGTLCDNRWPQIGEPHKEMIQILKLAQSSGVKLILWTCREDELLQEAVSWCQSQGLIFDAINDNLPDRVAAYGRNPRKLGADLYIDDRAFPGVEGGWRDLCQLI